MPAIELPPFTAKQREALRACRFVTSNLAPHNRLGLDEDEATAALLGPYTKYRRSTAPKVYEYEVHLTHPDAVAVVCDLVDAKEGR